MAKTNPKKTEILDALKALKQVEKELKRFNPHKRVEKEAKKVEKWLKQKLKEAS